MFAYIDSYIDYYYEVLYDWQQMMNIYKHKI